MRRKRRTYNIRVGRYAERRSDCARWISSALEWHSTDAHRQLCELKGKSPDECQNYPRVAVRAHGRLLVCGTNAFKPLCRRYAHRAPHHYNETDGSGRSPYDPQHNSSAIFVDRRVVITTGRFHVWESRANANKARRDPAANRIITFPYRVWNCVDGPRGERHGRAARASGTICIDRTFTRPPTSRPRPAGGPGPTRDWLKRLDERGKLYTATAADFSGTDPLVYREPVRTERSDLRLLNDPSFVGAVATQTHAIYSRVARVCINDKGGPHTYSDRWTSFFKARLNCSIPGEYPFYFDEIQSSSELISGVYGSGNGKNDILYAVFSTPQNAIGGSAVCAFSMRDIVDTFEGPFKDQETMNSNWLPLEREKVPKPQPGSCKEDSRSLPDSAVSFIKTHPLMDRAVPSFLARPLLIRVSLQYRFSAIAVHPHVQAMNGNKYDVIYVGTDDGRVIKAVNVAANEGDFNATVDEENRNPVRTAVISEVQVLPLGMPIKQMHVALTTEKLIVASNDVIKAVSLSHCGSIQSCRECVALQDPHCAWDSKQQQCTWVGNRQFPNPDRFLQNVEFGKTDICNKISALLPTDRDQSNRSPGTKKPTQKEPDSKQKFNDIQNEIEKGIEISEQKNSGSKNEP
ncbi:Semaphorin-1A, partial [Eumeta japonica]